MSDTGGGLMNLLKVGGLVVVFFGLKAFLDSQLFVQLTEFMKSLAPQFEAIFGGFKKIFQGDIIGGLFSILKGLAGIAGKILDSVATGIFNLIARFFGFEGTDSIFGSIKNAFMSVVNAVKEYFSFSAKELGIFNKFIDIVYFPLNLAINFLKDIFKFNDPDKPFRLSQFIVDVVTKVKDFFVNLFNFDAAGLISSVKDRIMNINRMMKALSSGGIAAVKAILISLVKVLAKHLEEYSMKLCLKITMSTFLEEEGGARQFRIQRT